MEDLLAHRRWVRTVALRLSRDPSEADDLEQETWLAAMEHPPRHGGSLRGWLGTVVRNVARNSRRGAGRRARHEAGAPDRDRPRTADELIAEAEAQQVLAREVLALDEPYRSTVLFRWFEDLPVAEVARRMDVPAETVKTRLRRAADRLRERMDARFGGDRRAWCLAALGGQADPASPGAAAGTKAALAGAAGGVAMAATAKWGVAAAAAVVLAMVALQVTSKRTTEVSVNKPFTNMTNSATTSETTHLKARAERAPEPLASVETAGFPAPIDLDRADRDLDLFGVVVREDGNPVPGATIQAIGYPWRRAQTLNWEGVWQDAPGVATTSSSDGTFALRLTRGQCVSLRFRREGLATLELVQRQAGERVRAVMAPAVRLVVAAHDTAGAPVPGVRLLVFRFQQQGDPGVLRRAVTGDDGLALLDDLPGGCQVNVMPESRLGNVGWKKADLPKSGETRLELVLPAGRTVRGRVIDADTGGAIAGARVGMSWPLVQSVTTNPDGSYELPGWTGDGFDDLHCVADGYARWNEAVGTRNTIDFALHRGYRVTARLVEPQGAPVAGAVVSAVAWERAGDVQRISTADALSGADGRFVIKDLDRNRIHTLTVVGPASGRLQRPVPLPAEGADEVDLGDVRLAAPRAIEGRVTSAKGEAAAGATVTLSGRDASQRYGNREERRTDDLGRFRFPDLSPGDYEILARFEGAPEIRTLVRLPAEKDVLDVQLGAAPAREVVVRVTDDAGAPVSGAIVQLHGGQGRPPSGTTDASGAVKLQAPDRKLDAIVYLPEAVSAGRNFLAHDSFDVPRGGAKELTFVLHEGGVVSGVVLDPEGNPVPRAYVSVEPSERSWESRPSGPDGRFRLTVPKTGSFALSVHGDAIAADGRTTEDLLLEGRVDGISPGATGVEIRCRRIATGRSLRVLVTTPDGKPASNAKVFVTTERGGDRKLVTTDAEGRATAEKLTARPYRVQVAPLGDWLGPDPVEVVPQGQEVAITLLASARISGVVVFADGRNAVSATVLVWRAGQVVASSRSMATDEKGEFTVLVPEGDAGPFSLKAWGQDNDGGYLGETPDVRPGESGVRIVVER